MSSGTEHRDVVVVGSGHNALVAACYLARAGRRVEVLEAGDVIGGAVSTVERFPGVWADRGSSAHIMIRLTGIVEELALHECGLLYQDLDPWALAPVTGRDGQPTAIEFWRSLEATAESIERSCGPADAAAYRRFVSVWRPRNEAVFDLFSLAPTPAALLRTMGRLARLSGLGTPRMVREMLGTADAVLDAHFESEQLKTALAWLAAQSGPPSHNAGTADLLGWFSMLHSVSPGHPIGGSGMLTQALAERLRRLGGQVSTGDAVTAIDARSAEGVLVRTVSGRSLRADRAISGTHVWTTADLLADAHPRAARRLRRRPKAGNGLGMVLRVASTEPPRYVGDTAGNAHRAMTLLCDSREELRRGYADFLAGRRPRHPAVLAMTPSVDDDTLAPDGVHTTTLWTQWHPRELDGETWDDVADDEASKILDEVERWAPGFRESIIDVHVQSPADLERELGLRGANVMHLEMSLDQMFSLRPTVLDAYYRVRGVLGTYLTGASTHPGGGVFGASGRSAARAVLADQRGSLRGRIHQAARGKDSLRHR
ncbi:NAD(P)-binding protein [Epidermidibacterium keratini]|uniref:Pyridine nucleotide-disulfide oxidoreductase domain-containing protein 2 n=1 Tax=Epidermidibacterium keratini TaxID=1891644 RepID=A0A7L4YJ97_9ACTN|nr:NAD(P)/FAD-dependent oxidoreductase [Epidermidibacterium keratini]QHB99157.1 NAD(P)-binding protein [Epidermidibacterium keratini]